MASLCRRQQCTIDRRGFRQELDSWRHKLIHCVGFESILEGLFGDELVEDLKLFKDFEPLAVSDWSFDENCLFCCLRRDKVKEHLIGLYNEGLEDTPKPLPFKDPTTISRLEKQAEEFLNAVLCRKDVPNFSDPHIPVVAREILQRMIRQFAAEYTSKTSPPQDSRPDSQPRSDQSLPAPPLLSGAPPPPTSPAATLAGPAHNQNPVLSKLLMADQDAPLDLTIKKPLAEPSEQDGVLDLSLKKNRNCSSLPVRSSSLSPAATMLKGESPDLRVAKAKDLQSTSTLEQFMAKLCPHHQRQIVDAIGFLQTEVKALGSSHSQKTSNSISGIQENIPEKSRPELRFPCESTPKSEVQNMSHPIPTTCTVKNVPENAVSLKTSVTAGPALDLRSPGSGTSLVSLASNSVDADNSRHGDHAPLKMKIMTSNAAAGKKLSCVLNDSLSSQSDTLEDRLGNSNSSSRTETHSARLSSSGKRHNQTSHTHQARQRETVGLSKDTPANLFQVHMTIPSDTARTARKTVRASSEHRNRDSTCRGLTDPDLGHCDIVFIDKPITECFKEQQRSMVPRRNARKSTRGHMYSDEIWELKTVRTLAGRGNCPNPMPELIPLVTPKQILSKPEGLPPVDMPFAGVCRETMNQQMATEESDESVMPGTGDIVEVAASKVDVVVEPSQTDQCQNKGQSAPPSPLKCPTEDKDSVMNTDVEQDETAESGMITGSEESAAQAPCEAVKDKEPESHESTPQMVTETVVEPLETIGIDEAKPQPSTDKLHNSEPVMQQSNTPPPVNQVEEEVKEDKREEMQNEQPQELQPETQIHHHNFEVTEEDNTTGPGEEQHGKETEIKTSELVDNVISLQTEADNDQDYDVSLKTRDTLKELPHWRRKKGTKIPLQKRLSKTETAIVGYVNGKPISASDRSLRRRASNTTSPCKSPVKSSQNVPDVSFVDSNIDSTIENEKLEEPPIPETHTPVKSVETSSVAQQVPEPSSDTPSSPNCKLPSRTKQSQKQKKAERDQDTLPVQSAQPSDPQSTESKRQLRSTRQKPPETQVLLPTPDAVTDISSPKPTTTLDLPSTEQLPSPPSPHPLPAPTTPLIEPSESAASEQSQQSTVPETVESSSENTQPVETEEMQKNEEERLQVKQKLRSAKALANDSKSEKQQLDSEVSSHLENQSPVKTEMQTQIMPLRSKRVLRKDAEANDVALMQKADVAMLEDRPASGHDGSSSIDKPTRMPLRSESSKAEMSQLTPVDNKKFALRSQRFAAPSTSGLPARQSDVASNVRIMPERVTKAQVRPPPVSSSVSHSSQIPLITPKQEPPKQTTNKFFETLTGEESQHLITNLNVKYDKMQKGWMQLDKEGQPATKYKNKADRQAAIWKSKRRTRKPKSSEHQKYSPVQMLFMKGFNLTSICRWFLESTETKSLVIVKKVNTRLPSETQLCFHSSSSASGTSQGVFPSLQAERLKKHLKKFAIASPVKSNPKSQKLIAKALEQETNAVKGKERELPCTTQTLTKSYSSAKASAQIGESQKSSGKSKNPASARILRKYSNIRGKMQVQQTTVRLKKASKILKSNKMKRLTTTKSAAKSNLRPSLKARKSTLPVSKQMKESAAKMERRKILAGKKSAKQNVQERAVRAQSSSRASKDATKKKLPKRCSQRLGSPKTSEHHPVDTSRSSNKKHIEAEKPEVEKPAVNKVTSAKMQTKESSQSTGSENKSTENVVETSQQSANVKVPASPDQVLTRSQRKMEAAVPLGGSPSHASKRATKSMTAQNASPKSAKKADEPTLTRSGALKSPAKRSQAASLPRSATKLATKRAQELLETPAKRTRTSLSK